MQPADQSDGLLHRLGPVSHRPHWGLAGRPRHLNQGKSVTTMWINRTLDKQIKLKLLKITIVWPFALYGSESWTHKASSTKLKAFETLCSESTGKIPESTNPCWTRSVQAENL